MNIFDIFSPYTSLNKKLRLSVSDQQTGNSIEGQDGKGRYLRVDIIDMPLGLTSVGLSATGALSVYNSPLVSDGIIELRWTGSSSQYVRGDGTLATFPSTGGITSLNGLTAAVQTFVDDTNVTIVSSVSTHTITWSGTLADSRIASAATWNAKEPGFTTLPISKGGTNSGTALSNNRVMCSSGGAITEASAITAARALKSDANGIPTHFDTTTEPSLTELSYVKGVTSAIQTQLDGKLSSQTITFGTRQGASYILALADAGKVIEMNVGSANTLTIPLNSTVNFPVGTIIMVSQYGAGQTTIAGAAGVTLRSIGGWTKIAARYGFVSLLQVATNEWYVYGALTA